jgi:hypothetical protein
VLEIATLKIQENGQPGAIGVLRVLKGNFKPGQMVAAYRPEGRPFGQGRIVPGERGIVTVARVSAPLLIGEYIPSNLEEAVRRQARVPLCANADPEANAIDARLKRYRSDFHSPEWEKRAPVAAFQSEAGKVHERVRHDPYFGGFIFRDVPEPHAVVMFTRNAEARLRRYTRDPRYKAQRVDLTLSQLEAMKDEMGGQLSRLGLRCFTVDGDEEHNTVTVTTPDIVKVQQAIAEGRLKPPRKFRLLPRGCPEFR